MNVISNSVLTCLVELNSWLQVLLQLALSSLEDAFPDIDEVDTLFLVCLNFNYSHIELSSNLLHWFSKHPPTWRLR